MTARMAMATNITGGPENLLKMVLRLFMVVKYPYTGPKMKIGPLEMVVQRGPFRRNVIVANVINLATIVLT